MSKHVSELVRGMGAAAHFIQYLSTHLPDEELYFLVTKAGEGTMQKMFEVARNDREVAAGVVFTLDPNAANIGELIAMGNYDYENTSFRELMKSFSNKHVETMHTVVTLMEKKMTNPEHALSELKRDGYEPVSLASLLAFGIQYPRVQVSKFPIVTIDTNSRGDDFVPSLGWGNTGRRIGLVSMHELSSCWVLCKKVS